jgi:hypothetical protein
MEMDEHRDAVLACWEHLHLARTHPDPAVRRWHWYRTTPFAHPRAKSGLTISTHPDGIILAQPYDGFLTVVESIDDMLKALRLEERVPGTILARLKTAGRLDLD